jgi:PAS domain S-box-containing protein
MGFSVLIILSLFQKSEMVMAKNKALSIEKKAKPAAKRPVKKALPKPKPRADSEKFFFQHFLEYAPVAVIAIDGNSIIRFVNLHTEELSGHPREDLVGKNFEALIPERFRTTHDKKKSSYLKQPQKREMGVGIEIFCLHRDGREIPVEIGLNPVEIEGNSYILITISNITVRKKVEHLANETNQKYRNLFESSMDAILIVDDNQQYVDVNSAACELLGYTKEELLTKKIGDIVATDTEVKDQLWDEMIENQNSANSIYLKRQDGTILLTEYTATANIQPNRHMSIIRDVTERKRVENKLRESEQRLDTILQTLMDGVVMVTTEGKIIFANHAAETILGIKKDEIEGKYYNSREWKQLDEFDNPYPLDQLPLAIAMREQRPVEAIKHAIVSPEGEKKWLTVNAAPLFDEEGNLYGAIAGFQDSTHRKQIEQQLVLNTRAIESVSEGVVIADINQPDEPVIYANQGFYNITGYSPQEVLGKNCRFLQGADTDPNTIEAIEKSIVSGETFEGEILNYKKDGTPFWNYLRLYPITDQRGKTNYMAGFQSDITERKQMEEMLRLSEQRFMATFHFSPVPIGLIAIATGEVIDMNEACAEMLGFSRVETLGQLVQKFEFTASPERFKELFAELQSKGRIKNSERRFRRRSGEISTGLLSAELIEVDHQLCALLIVNDITEQKQTERRLRRAQEMLAQTNRVANIGGWEIDPAANTLYWSEITKQTHEVDADYTPTVAAAIRFYKEGESRNKITEALQNAIQYGTPYDLELQLITNSGKEIWVRTLGEAEREDGTLVRLYGSFQDITERKQAELQLNEQLNELIRWSNITTGREMRVLELKSEVNRLLGELGKPPRYSSTGAES